MNKWISLGVFSALLLIVIFFAFLITGNGLPGAEIEYLWFYSGIVMVIFSMFFIEPYYTAPTNVISNAVAVLLVLFAIKTNIPENSVISFLWNVVAMYSGIVLLLALIALLSSDNKSSEDSLRNKMSGEYV